MPERPPREFVKIKDVPAVFKKLTGIAFVKKTIYVWMHKGKRAYDGRNIKLISQMRFGRRYTTYDWIRKFIEEVG